MKPRGLGNHHNCFLFQNHAFFPSCTSVFMFLETKAQKNYETTHSYTFRRTPDVRRTTGVSFRRRSRNGVSETGTLREQFHDALTGLLFPHPLFLPLTHRHVRAGQEDLGGPRPRRLRIPYKVTKIQFRISSSGSRKARFWRQKIAVSARFIRWLNHSQKKGKRSHFGASRGGGATRRPIPRRCSSPWCTGWGGRRRRWSWTSPRTSLAFLLGRRRPTQAIILLLLFYWCSGHRW